MRWRRKREEQREGEYRMKERWRPERRVKARGKRGLRREKMRE